MGAVGLVEAEDLCVFQERTVTSANAAESPVRQQGVDPSQGPFAVVERAPPWQVQGEKLRSSRLKRGWAGTVKARSPSTGVLLETGAGAQRNVRLPGDFSLASSEAFAGQGERPSGRGGELADEERKRSCRSDIPGEGEREWISGHGCRAGR